MHLARFPRLHLAHLPTPLEPMPRLSKELGAEIWIKRDDCTGLSTGGNKTRKLEFLMAEALAEGADMVMTQGATQTNHGRQTAAFAAKLGLDCHIRLEDRTGKTCDEKFAARLLDEQRHGFTGCRVVRDGDLEHPVRALDSLADLAGVAEGNEGTFHRGEALRREIEHLGIVQPGKRADAHLPARFQRNAGEVRERIERVVFIRHRGDHHRARVQRRAGEQDGEMTERDHGEKERASR